MDKLVFLDPNDINETPFTTSKVIAEHGKVDHHTVTKLIQTYESDLKEFGILRFKIEEIKGRGQPPKIYELNEEQSTLLITYMKNTLPVRKFKRDLVKQFYIMQKELEKRIVTREIGKRARRALTDAIQSLPDSPHKSMKYKHYTDLIYKIVFGKNAKQLKQEYGIKKKSEELRDRFTSEENDKIDKLEQQIGVLVALEYNYKTVKDILAKKYLMSA